MRLYILIFLIIALVSFSCGKKDVQSIKKDSTNNTLTNNSEKNQDSTKKIEPDKKTDTSTYNYYNNISKFIAGEDLDEKSVFYDHTQTYLYKNYKNSMTQSWNQVSKIRLNKMKEWYDEEIAPEVKDSINLFYPFSGPDILHSFTFYPYAKNYYFIALENTGSLPEIENMNITNVGAYLFNLSQSIRDVMFTSYFLTKKMMVALKKDKVDGALPILCLFISKTGNSILTYESLYMNRKGDFSDEKNSDYTTPCLRIVFKKNNSNYIQTIYYFKQDLSDGESLNQSHLLDVIKSKGEFNTYTKAASYLMHHGNFSTVRDFIINNSITVLQDDTGIPNKYFDRKIWKEKLYGDYIAPISLFQMRDQPDLRAAYKKNREGGLPFNMGYHVNNSTQHIMFFSKINN